MARHKNPPGISLPRGWSRRVKSATLHVISLAQFALAHTRGWAVNSQVAQVRHETSDEPGLSGGWVPRVRHGKTLARPEVRCRGGLARRCPSGEMAGGP